MDLQNQRPRRGESIEERREISHLDLGLGTEELRHVGVPRENSLLPGIVSSALWTVLQETAGRREMSFCYLWPGLLKTDFETEPLGACLGKLLGHQCSDEAMQISFCCITEENIVSEASRDVQRISQVSNRD